jgi:actin-related protein
VISTKLYSACLLYLRTEPSNGSLDESGNVSNMNDNYFHFLTSASPAQMVCDAVYRCDRDQQAKLLGDVVVCGGGSCITGASGVVGSSALGGGGAVGGSSLLGDEQAFPDRLREEVEAIVHKHTMGWKVKVTSPNISELAICSWLGGSILGSLGTFQDMWISKADYEEYGAAIVNRKCP